MKGGRERQKQKETFGWREILCTYRAAASMIFATTGLHELRKGSANPAGL